LTANDVLCPFAFQLRPM